MDLNLKKSQFKKGVSLVGEYDENITYKCDCDCGDNEHSVWIDFEIEKDIISLTFYKDIQFFDYPQYDIMWSDEFIKMIKKKNYGQAILFLYKNTALCFLKQYYYRFRKSIRIFFTGNLRMNEDFILREGDHFNNFIEALIEGKEIMESKKYKN